MRIRKDYTKRRRTPVNIANSVAADEAKMGANSGGNASNQEAMISHEKAVNDRAKRAVIPNAKLNK